MKDIGHVIIAVSIIVNMHGKTIGNRLLPLEQAQKGYTARQPQSYDSGPEKTPVNTLPT